MRLVGRLARVVVFVLLVVVVAGGTLVAAVTVRALPQTSGTLSVAGLASEVTIHRDEAGIARIYADTPRDLFFGQGFVHAQDRLWQMEVWRHISAGRLSELFGESALDTDRFVRTLGWRRAAERDLASFSPDVVAALRAYADGVNAYLDTHRGSLGLPFVVTGVRTGTGGIGGYQPEPWTPLDSAAWQKVQAWNLGGDFGREIFRLLADAQLGDPARTDDLIPPYPTDRPIIAPSGAAYAVPPVPAPAARAADPGALAGWRRLGDIAAGIPQLTGFTAGRALLDDGGVGSNEWVVGPSHSATGGALLANDPHLGLGMPSVWYMNGLHCREVGERCPFDVVGVSFPGVPAVVLGHNGRIAWGATNLAPDVQDLFVETPDPRNETAYLFDGRSVPYETREEEIAVAGGERITIRVRESVHGPIVNDVVASLADEPPMALRWTALVEPDRTIEALFRINTASDFSAFREGLRVYGSPSQNFVYADAAGQIGYQFPGYVPVRAGAPAGRPRPGDGNHEWIGRIPFDELPSQVDPPAGRIVTANNAVVDAGYPYFIASVWDYGDRAARIATLLDEAADGGVTVDEMGRIQADTYVLRAERVVPRLEEASPATDDGRELLSRILAWDRTCDADSEGCAAYLAFELRLAGAIFDDELGPVARDYVGSGASGARIAALLDEPDAAWWDRVDTPAAETGPAIVGDALDATAAELRATLGEPDEWTWGRLHTITFREGTLGTSGIGPLEWYLNNGPRPAPGAAGAINNLYHDASRLYPDPDDPDFEPVGLDRVFEVTNGPSYRLVIDLSDPDGATIIQSTGQSGNPFDRHYGDLVDRWLAGESVLLPWRRAAVERDAVDTLVLVPQKPT